LVFLGVIAFAAAGVSLLLPSKKSVETEIGEAIFVASPVSLDE
jgi:hypothetical protein